MWQPFHRQFPLRSKQASSSKRKRETSNYFLTKPKTKRLETENVYINGLEIGHTSIQGFRPTMEDTHMITKTKLDNHTLIAVFDGHAGQHTAYYLSEHILQALEKEDLWIKYTQLSISDRAKSSALLCEMFVELYIHLDEALLPLELNSGATAICSLITPTHIFAASVGDSRCILGLKDDTVIIMSEDHKPENPKEKKRIITAGGFVYLDRVNGELAMSRAMGDFQYKTNSRLGVSQQMVICIPDVAVHVRTGEEKAMILACDGVWDIMQNSDAIAFISALIDENDPEKGAGTTLTRPLRACELADAVVDVSLKSGSTDNISAIVVKF